LIYRVALFDKEFDLLQITALRSDQQFGLANIFVVVDVNDGGH
jgi:hypothetical protein